MRLVVLLFMAGLVLECLGTPQLANIETHTKMYYFSKRAKPLIVSARINEALSSWAPF
jgi:hypothetical protein